MVYTLFIILISTTGSLETQTVENLPNAMACKAALMEIQRNKPNRKLAEVKGFCFRVNKSGR